MSLRFLADADLNARIRIGLVRKEPAIDFLDAKSANILGLPDPDVLRVAAQLDRVLVSHDRRTMPRHFSQFLLQHNSPGLIILPQDLEIGFAIEDLLLTWAMSGDTDMANSILYLPL